MVPAVPHFSAAYEVDRPIAEVFEWHRDTRNAAAISPPSLLVEQVEGRFPVEQGDRVRLVVHQRGNPIRQRWLVRIAELRSPTLIVDEMLEGPFARWRHEHCFRDLGGGRTRVTDRVTWALPLGLHVVAGPIAGRLLSETFAHRQRRSRDLLEAGR
jgi:ligand-binding SRPBCC domain-containing protein